MIKDILVNLPVRSNSDETAHFAVSVARRLDAHITGAAFVYAPFIPPAPALALPPNFVEQQQEEALRFAKEALEQFERAAKREELPHKVHQLSLPTTDAPQDFAEIARRFDLSIVPQANPDEFSINGMIAEAALFASGRPILVMPYTQRDPIKLDRVTVCWDGSRAAARALADALPLLKLAKSVNILIAEGEPPKSNELAGADVAQHLARHGIKVIVEQTMLTIDIASTILNFASDHGTDLLVMGGYGHSRLREFILGGATRGILKSMTVPVLMSH
ncbi:MAG TPA: universal stress protein [Pseudolabrys sp.]|jgi:nucleotide-binding universal stress UspA family protein|nr:universal stress protein [Pseudolabrys sp.]HVU21870.1 universal stress protein [Rhizomicrobium sp.]